MTFESRDWIGSIAPGLIDNKKEIFKILWRENYVFRLWMVLCWLHVVAYLGWNPMAGWIMFLLNAPRCKNLELRFAHNWWTLLKCIFPCMSRYIFNAFCPAKVLPELNLSHTLLPLDAYSWPFLPFLSVELPRLLVRFAFSIYRQIKSQILLKSCRL